MVSLINEETQMTKFKKYLTIGFAIGIIAISSTGCDNPKEVVIETISTVQTEIQEGVCTGAEAVGGETGTLCK